jgi:hypothetical protein
MLIPSAALGLLLLVGAGALIGYPAIEDRRYMRELNAEIDRVEPQARKVDFLNREIDTARRRAIILDQFRGRTRQDLDVLGELTKLLAPPAWVSSLELNRNAVVVGGEIEQAAPLLKLIDASPLFAGSEFTVPPVRIPKGEAFRVRSRREGAAQ